MTPKHTHLKADTLRGTIAGTILVIWLQLQPGEMLKTMALASLGAATSFLVSLLLKWSIQQWHQKKQPPSDKNNQ
jgi:mannitol-specific phosphotransferase system IIBC component